MEDIMKDQGTLILFIPLVGQVSITLQVQRGDVAGDCLLSRTIVSTADLDEDGLHSDDETSLLRAISLRRSAPWQIAPYMTRPI